MKALLKNIKKVSVNIYTSIAFYPIVISVGFMIFGFGILWLEYSPFVAKIKDTFPYLLIRDKAIAETMLSTLVGGIISLTVFSFTMVMVVLGQASSNFSPRLLPGLVSDKRHQRILGIYLGTLLYCVLNIMFLGSGSSQENNFGLAVMVAAVLGVLCLALFVQFIHGISTSIQIHHIVERVFQDGCRDVAETNKKEDYHRTAVVSLNENSKTIVIDRTGYYKGFDSSLISKSVRKQLDKVEILVPRDTFVWRGSPILKVPGPVSQDVREQLLFAIRISSNRHGNTSYYQAMTQLMEIAVKALSPGINDPGTAIQSIHKLGELMNRSVSLPNKTRRKSDDGGFAIIENRMSGEIQLQKIIQPMRIYAKGDISVLEALIRMLLFLQSSNLKNVSFINAVHTELQCIRRSIANNLDEQADRTYLLNLLTSSN